MTERRDYYGNPTLHTLIAVPHESLLVRAESRVSVRPRAQAALSAPRAIANGLGVQVDQPGLGRVPLLGPLHRVGAAGRGTEPARPVPALGEHTEEVLGL